MSSLLYKPERKGKVELIPGMNRRKFKDKKYFPENCLTTYPEVISLRGRNIKLMEKSFLELRKTYAENLANSELKLKSIMLEILWLYFESTDENSLAEEHPKSWKNIEKAINYIQNNYMHPIEIKDVCNNIGISLNYFCNMFKQYTHSTPHHYINAVRLQKAKELMLSADFNFSEIARMVGFSGIHVFSKVFKKHERLSPSEYLKGLKRDNAGIIK
ncbi:MAG: helix-turn-helix transcriptional regulator [Planctomycetota bacterium]|jgi:AraC-like DNA-binding protein